MSERQVIELDCKHFSLRRSGGKTTKVRSLYDDHGIATLELSYTNGLATDVLGNSKAFEKRCSELCQMVSETIKAAREGGDDGKAKSQKHTDNAAVRGSGIVFFNVHKNIHGILQHPVFGVKVDAYAVGEADVMARIDFIARGLLNELHALDIAVPYARRVKAARKQHQSMPHSKRHRSSPFH